MRIATSRSGPAMGYKGMSQHVHIAHMEAA